MTTFPGRGHRYDVAVVGGGVTGCEAAYRLAVRGFDVLLVTTSLDTVYMLAHGRYELEPPGDTLMARLVGELRPGSEGVERWALHRVAKYALEATAGLHLLQSNVTGLITRGGRVEGVLTWEGVERLAGRTALCVGSFLGARLRQGRLEEAAGRLGEMAYDELLHDLEGNGVTLERRELTLDDTSEGLPYRVEFSALRPEELDGTRITRLPALHAAGVCAGGGGTYEAAAADGLRLAEELATGV